MKTKFISLFLILYMIFGIISAKNPLIIYNTIYSNGIEGDEYRYRIIGDTLLYIIDIWGNGDSINIISTDSSKIVLNFHENNENAIFLKKNPEIIW